MRPVAKPKSKLRGRIERGNLSRLAVFIPDPALMTSIMTAGSRPDLTPITTASEVATGDNGVIEGKRIRRFVDLSTIGSQMAVRIHDLLAKRGIVQLDSPVSGGVGGAEKGTLAVMVSGQRAEFEAVKLPLAVIGKLFFIGEKPGSAQTMKLANNLLSATAVVATSEAVVMGVKAGLDPAVMIEVINAGCLLYTSPSPRD